MLDVERQLRDYFEEVVERVTAEDVRVRVSTERGVRLPERRLRLRPLAAGAIGFGLAMTLLGIVVVTDRLFGAEAGDATSGPGSLMSPEGGATPWIVIPVAVGLVLLIFGTIFVRRTRNASQQGGTDMQTMERDPLAAPIDNETGVLQRRNRVLGWLTVFLAVAVVGLGLWLAAEVTSSSTELAPTAEVEQLLTDYQEAWANADSNAYLALLTDNFVLETSRFGRFTGPEQVAAWVPARQGLEQLGGYSMIGTGPWYVTVASHHDSVPFPGFSEGVDSVSVFKIVDQGGTLKVAYHKSFGPAFG
ncbi:MAG: hypothetical protein OER12_01600 [Acidimicrobiia bacterium]|nr:hypothetical protein [Acidimicrobiia bacterium]